MLVNINIQYLVFQIFPHFSYKTILEKTTDGSKIPSVLFFLFNNMLLSLKMHFYGGISATEMRHCVLFAPAFTEKSLTFDADFNII